MKTIRFEYYGTANKIDIASIMVKGVYLWVYKNQIPRIIYVGTGYSDGGIWERNINNHIKKSFKGLNLLFAPDDYEDIYDLMTLNNNFSNIIEYLSLLVNSKKIWIPNKNFDNGTNNNIFKSYKFFEQNWLLQNKVYYFLNNCEIWGCSTENIEDAMYLESQLQIGLGIKYNLVYYTKYRVKQNWLGKQEKRNSPDLFERKFTTSNINQLPDYLNKELILLENIPNSKNEKQWFDKIG